MTHDKAQAEMPRYRCHKEVWALNYVRKHSPKVGGYFVVYPDGYQSWSPEEAFESGYTRV